MPPCNSTASAMTGQNPILPHPDGLLRGRSIHEHIEKDQCQNRVPKKEKGTGLICQNGPKGASHKLVPSPFISSFFFLAYLSHLCGTVSGDMPRYRPLWRRIDPWEGCRFALPVAAEDKIDNSLGGVSVAIRIYVNLSRGVLGRVGQ